MLNASVTLSSQYSSRPPLYVGGAADDYPLEPVEFRLLCRITRFSGWNGDYSREKPSEIAEAVRMDVRTVRYTLKLLCRAGVIEEVIEGVKRVGWRPRPMARWADPDELLWLRAEVYSNRKRAPIGAPNVVPIAATAAWARRRSS
jgi:hypothetical protein